MGKWSNSIWISVLNLGYSLISVTYLNKASWKLQDYLATKMTIVFNKATPNPLNIANKILNEIRELNFQSAGSNLYSSSVWCFIKRVVYTRLNAF